MEEWKREFVERAREEIIKRAGAGGQLESFVIGDCLSAWVDQ